MESDVRMSKVDHAVALDEICTDFRIELDPDEAIEWARRVSYYNAMRPDTMTRIVAAVNARIPRLVYGEDNPNNGRPCHTFLVGNEGSRVVYVEVELYPLRHRIPALTETDICDLQYDLENIGAAHDADESSVWDEDAVRFTVRYWWD